MIRALLAASLLAGCAQSQDLGGAAPAPQKNAHQGIDPSSLNGAPQVDPGPPAPLDTCPALVPVDRSSCALNVDWSCRYPRRDGLTVHCACGVDKRWTCLSVVDVDGGAVLDRLPVSDASCSEGAPCGEGVRCTIPRVRTCTCMSSSRFVCSKPAE